MVTANREIRLIIPNFTSNQKTPSVELTNKKTNQLTDHIKRQKNENKKYWYPDPLLEILIQPAWDNTPHICTFQSSLRGLGWLEVLDRTWTQDFSCHYLTFYSLAKLSLPLFPHQPHHSRLPTCTLSLHGPSEGNQKPLDHSSSSPIAILSILLLPTHLATWKLRFGHSLFCYSSFLADLIHSTFHRLSCW